ncbi:hypothetical protein [uncultured Draconibacterium sp.]|uniref:hypothetical protein n=1 Tax=uncultured Draconibacterium sp. TaxID=1573823 RepID=UPI0029C89539|nr:hypothetical protein [uncultured Draconibacterium sp.]
MRLLNKIFGKSYPFDIDGLKFLKREYEYIVCNIDTSVTPDIVLIEKLFANLPHDLEIFFFDKFHPTLSDPGAYVTARKVNDRFVYYLGNHGWTSSKYWTSKEYLVNYLLKNWTYNQDILRISKVFSEINSDSVENENIWDTQLTEVFNKDWTYKLYEVNGSYLLSVICGTVGLFDRNIVLSADLTLDYKNKGIAAIDKLAEKIRHSPNDYEKEHVTIRQSNK